jgi:hypothetical protein
LKVSKLRVDGLILDRALYYQLQKWAFKLKIAVAESRGFEGLHSKAEEKHLYTMFASVLFVNS